MAGEFAVHVRDGDVYSEPYLQRVFEPARTEVP